MIGQPWTATLVIAAATLLACVLIGGLGEFLAINPIWPKRPGII